MRLNLENCPICQTRLSADDEFCPVCRNSRIADVDLIDGTDRANYKKWLNEKQAQWNNLLEILNEQLSIHGENWESSKNWHGIWGKIKVAAKALDIREQNAIELGESLREKIKLQESASSNSPPAQPEAARHETQSIEQDEPEVKAKGEDESSKEAKAAEFRTKLASWVAGLSNAEWKATDWNNFLKSLDGSYDEEQVKAARDIEINRQFSKFKTASVTSAGKLINTRNLVVRQFVQELDNQINLYLIRIPAGKFEMGMSSGFKHEKPVRHISISEFYIGKFPVTQAQWRFISALPPVNIELESNPSYFRDDNCPVDSVSWIEANEFCARLSTLTGGKYRLPSEAEWEYAARGGSSGSAFAFGEVLTPEFANFDGRKLYASAKAFDKTTEVGRFQIANAFGLFDIHGNVWEWCADEWRDEYDENAPKDGTAWISSDNPTRRVLRGGAWCNQPEICRSSERIGELASAEGKLYYVGFRVAADAGDLPKY